MIKIDTTVNAKIIATAVLSKRGKVEWIMCGKKGGNKQWRWGNSKTYIHVPFILSDSNQLTLVTVWFDCSDVAKRNKQKQWKYKKNGIQSKLC